MKKLGLLLGIALLCSLLTSIARTSVSAAPTSSPVILDVGSDGSDGAFTPSGSSFVVDLRLAPTAPWNSPGNGNGVYDPDLLAVVFKYSDATVPAGTQVSVINHRTRAPVIWLVEGNVIIQGQVTVQGKQDLFFLAHNEPGPGRFRGGVGSTDGNNLVFRGFSDDSGGLKS